MKKFFVLLFTYIQIAGSLFGSPQISWPSIVFVHIGDHLPVYLETAIKQARLFNSCPIFLVANKNALAEQEEALKKYYTNCVPCESLLKTNEHLAFIQNSKLDKSFREGFWNRAAERFFYLQDLIRQYQLMCVVHLENDVMIYADVFSLLPTFRKLYPHIGMTFDNDQRCVPGFIYVSDSKSMDHLAQFMVSEFCGGKIDMLALGNYYRQFGGLYTDQLPIIMQSYVANNVLINSYRHIPKNKFQYCKNDNEFQSIFDGAALGQYLGGVDPRNDPSSKPGYISDACVFDPSRLIFSWKIDKNGRKIPYAKYGETEYRINNLHIHSKKLALFLSDQNP